MSFLVDANVLSEAVRRSPAPVVIDWLTANDAALWISAITLGEIEKGIVRLSSGARRRQLDLWLHTLRNTMVGRILAFGPAEASEWARYVEKQRAKGRLLPTIDSMVAATALVHHLSVVTRNETDFPDVRVVNPWGGAA